MGFLSDAIDKVIRGVRRGRADLKSVVRSALLFTPVWSVITLLALLESMSFNDLPRLSFGLIVGLLSSSPFQVLGSRMVADARYLGVLSPVIGVLALLAVVYPPVPYLLSRLLSESFGLKLSHDVVLAAELTGIVYTLTCMVAASWKEYRWKAVLQIVASWTAFSVAFAVLAAVTSDVLRSFVLSSSLLAITLTASLVANARKHLENPPEITKEYLVGCLVVAAAAALDYFVIALSSIAYYAMMFFDKIVIWCGRGFPYPPLDVPASVGMVPLLAGTFAAGIFWIDVGDDLDRIYRVESRELEEIGRRMFLQFIKGAGIALALSGVLALVTASFVRPRFHYWMSGDVAYLLGPVLKASSALIHAVSAVPVPPFGNLATLVKWIERQLAGANPDLLVLYLLGSVPGALVVYTYPQLITFRREIEATVALSLVPIAELLAWHRWGVKWLALGYLMGTCASATVCALTAVRMWLNLHTEAYRVLSYNNFVSYVIEVQRHGGEEVRPRDPTIRG
ncbi:hypothetical protein [Methanopyrus kandleri]|uniref:Uncharacterized membrane protein specific for M.kandleri, MK-16 family n=1 Tax=Methanopyrus kandleri (strain AV19 / DSM 6324 / JCM 9639 / NBRC 100938) TaxID=190192 RepID=Q8TVT3_METKA|nr:hypothetical protein [Methanopyrus kandleri]AAM02518.1 Uncharacterized membrane protein specific for M.kandleri, MK-16 family [Methanopyrus kandleri AV19]